MSSAHDEFCRPNELRGFSPADIKAVVKSVPRRPTSRIQCVRCNRPLPLRMSDVGEQAARWLCSRCGLPFAAICMGEQLAEYASWVRLDTIYFDTDGMPEISAEQRAVVERIAKKARQNNVPVERRRSPRVSQSLVVPAVVLGENLNPIGDPMKVMVANISREGIGLVHSRPITRELIALELLPADRDPVQVIVKLIRCCPLQGHYYELGGYFVVRLGSEVE